MNELIDPCAVIRTANEQYFELVSTLFENEIRQFREANLTTSQFIQRWLDGPEPQRLANRAGEIADTVSLFWERHAAELTRAVFELDVLKCTVGSDIFPFRVEQKLHSVGCYADTFVVQDYIRQIAVSDPRFSRRHASFGLVAYAIEIHQREKLFHSDLTIPPIIMFDQEILNDGAFRHTMIQRSAKEMCDAINRLFGQSFTNVGQTHDFVRMMPTIDDVCTKLITEEYSISDTGGKNLREQLSTYIQDASRRIENFGANAGDALWSILLANVSAATEQFIRSDLMDGTPMVHGNLEWEYILRQLHGGKKVDLSATRGIQKGSEQSGFLLRYVNDDQLIQLRKEGALEELRARIRKAIRDIEVSNASDVEIVTAEVNRELTSLLLEHQRELDKLKTAGKRFFGVDVAPLLGSMSLIVAGASLNSPVLNTLAGIAGISGTSSIKNVALMTKDLLEKRRKLKSSAAAILCRLVKK